MVLRAKDEIKLYYRSCVLCTRLKAETMKHMMGDLPSYRVNPARPFLKCGVDYCGPFSIKPLQPRSKVTLKAYVSVFVCFTTRVIHLELVSNLSTAAFIAAFRRFMARRGVPEEIRSDCGTNFIGASKELKQPKPNQNRFKPKSQMFPATKVFNGTSILQGHLISAAYGKLALNL